MIGRILRMSSSRACCICGSIICLALLGCARPDEGGVTDAFAEFQKAVAVSDAKALSKMLSAASNGVLQDKGRHEDLREEYINFIISQLRPACPLFERGSTESNASAVVCFVGKNKEVHGRVSFVYERSSWKLDVVKPVEQWKRLRQWSSDVAKVMNSNTPVVKGTTIGGIHIMRPSPDDIIKAFEVPGITDREDCKP